MPIVIVLDVSLSMSRPVPTFQSQSQTQSQSQPHENGRSSTRISLAVSGINALLDHLSVNSRLEFVALMVFSSLYEVVCSFTRDYEVIKQKLRKLEDFDRTCLDGAILGACHLVLAEWGHQTHAHIILITDGCIGATPPVTALPPPAFPCTLHIVCIASPNEPSISRSSPIYRKLIESVSGVDGAPLGSLYMTEQILNASSVNTMFRRLCNEHLAAWRGVIRCGALESRITLAPAPLPHMYVTDFESVRLTMSTTLEISGFIAMQDIGSPMALSRHIVLPIAPATPLLAPKTPTPNSKGETSEAPNTPEEDPSDTSKMPNFCVLLHGSLKVENMAGLVQLGDDWYGFVHSWADSKKKSNLMLSVLPPGDDAVPWLGLLSQLGSIDESGENFPVRVSERRSYSSSSGGTGAGAVWVHPAGLQTDIHKLLRHARKLPDKTHHFFKEVNRVRRAALALGWVEALEAAASVLEREAAVLPAAATPPLSMGIRHLRNTTDPKIQLPLS